MKKILSPLITFLLLMQSIYVVSAAETLPNVNCGVYYDEANQQFNSFMHVTKNGYEKDATLYIAAYKNAVLIDYKTVKLSDLEDTSSIYATVDYDSEASFKDYSFKYFMCDENLKPLKSFPVFTVQDPPLPEETPDTFKISGVVVENTTTSLDDGLKTIELTKPAKVKISLRDTYGSTHPAFEEFLDLTVQEFEDIDICYNFFVGNSSVENYLGKRVDLYVTENESTDEFIITDCVEYPLNDVVTFTLDQYSELVSTSGKYKIEYFKNSTDKDTTDLFVTGADVVYNNVGGYDVDDIFDVIVTADSVYGGKVTAIDNDSDAAYDVIFVEVGATAVVEEVNGSKVEFKEAAEIPVGLEDVETISGIKVDEDAENEIFKFFKDGEEIAVTDLKEWDVLTIVANGDDAKYITAEVINSTVSGAIAGTSSSNTSATAKKYVIDGKKYDVAAGNYKAGNLQIGDAGIFYIDKYGKIAAFNEDSSVAGGTAGTYGYVLYAAKNEGGVSANVVQVKMITANGVETFEAASKVKYYASETPVSLGGDSATLLSNVMGQRYELIKYTTNAAGEINAIYVADYDTEKFDGKGEVGGAYDADNFRLGTALDEDATVFFLATSEYDADPETEGVQDPSEEDLAGNNNIIEVDGNYYKINPSSCVMGTLADLVDEEEYTAKAYLDSKGEYANLLVVTTGFGKVTAASSIAVITDVIMAQNDDFEACYVLSYFVNGELKENVYTTADATIDGVSEGDIVKINVASNGYITMMELAVDFDDAIRNDDGSIDLAAAATVRPEGAKEQFLFGIGDDYKKDTRSVEFDGEFYSLKKAKNIYVIDASLKVGRVDVGSAANFAWDKNLSAEQRELYGDYVFVRTYDGRVEDVVIIKNVVEDYDDLLDAE